MKRVTQIEAKRGEFIDSYETKESFDIACARLEKAVKLQSIRRELVYIIIPVEHKLMWQIFLMP
jgi:hypothetical protein